MLGLGLTLCQIAVRGGRAPVGPQILISNRTQDENTAIGTAIGSFTVVGGTGTYTFTKTADPDSAFTLTAGVLKNAIVFDYETATAHNVTIHADNGAGSTANRTLAIFVNDIDEVPPVITVSPSQTIPENSAFSLTLTADKPVTWSKTGGADSALFTLTSGVLSMTAKDFEVPTDANTDNAYIVQVTATSTAFAVSTNLTITVTVTDVAGPTITSSATQTTPENSAFSMTLTASESSTWAKVGGADTALFTLSGATLSMTAQDFEIPTDADANNSYIVQVKATSVATGEVSAAQTITVTVTDVTETGTAPSAPALVLTSAANDNTPDFSLSGDLQVGDVVTISAYTDALLTTLEDTGTGTVTGAGAITITGQLGPLADGAKWYDATTTRSGSTSAISNVVSNTVDTVAPTISSSASASVAENTTAVITATVSGGDTVAWSISGTDAAFFTINAATGVLVFTSAPDFETPLDAGANNVYNLTITATDLAGNATNQSFAATVTDVSEGGGTVTADAASITEIHRASASPQTLPNVTVASGSNLALLVCLGFDTGTSANTPTVTSLVWDAAGANQALTLIHQSPAVFNVGGAAALYGLVGVTPGVNKTITLTTTDSSPMFIGAVAFSGVDQTGGTTSFPHSVDTGVTPATTINVTSATGNKVVAVAVNGGGQSGLTGTQIYNDTTNGTVVDSFANYMDGASTVAIGNATALSRLTACDIKAA